MRNIGTFLKCDVRVRIILRKVRKRKNTWQHGIPEGLEVLLWKI